MTTNLLAASSNKLGFDLWKSLRAQPGNLAFSPASISTALTLSWAGARGETAAEMANVLNLDISPEAAMSEYARLTTSLIYDAGSVGIELAIANRLFGEKSLTFKESFLDIVREVATIRGTPTPYGSGTEKSNNGLETLDFENYPESARDDINAWIESRTKNRVLSLLPPGSVTKDTRMVIANALYFLANWRAQFSEKHTSIDEFKEDGKKYACNMMYRQGNYRFMANREISVVELPYVGGNMSMIIVLPHDTDGLRDIEQTFTETLLNSWKRNLREQSVAVRLPRFTIDPGSPIKLSNCLQGLGMEKAFDALEADFSGILDEKVALSEAYHKTFIKVNEKGTEMAAATAVAMTRSANMGQSFRADHPFAWFILDNDSDLVLGMGRVTEPKE